jgi:prepilin-type processing-associated H-X9-DG protein
MQCQNNLKQIGLAAHNYESAYQMFPPGINNTTTTASPGIGGSMAGTHAYLLPYMEQTNVFNLFPAGTWPFPSTVSYYPSAAGCNAKVKPFLCPSSDAENATPALGCFAFFVYNSGGMTGYYFAGNPSYGRTNYASVAGYLGNTSPSYVGIYAMNTKTKMTDITDGTSNTLAFGECGIGRDFYNLWYSSNLPTAWGLAAAPAWYQYGSKHTNIVNFAFGDGSVRSLATSFNNTQYQYAAGMTDGAVVTFN